MILKINIILTNDKGEQFVGEVELTKINDKKRVKKILKIKEDKSKPIFSIKKIYQENFFKNVKKLRDVNSKLKTLGFNFKEGSIQYALDHADFLDRRGEKGKYKWIQKFPPE